MAAGAYRGPLYVPTPAEIRELRDALHGRPGEVAAGARAKLDAAMEADPRFRVPLR